MTDGRSSMVMDGHGGGHRDSGWHEWVKRAGRVGLALAVLGAASYGSAQAPSNAAAPAADTTAADTTVANTTATDATVATPEARRRAIQRGLDYLRARGQAADGSFSSGSGPGVTALVTTAMLRSGLTPDDPTVAKALQYLLTFVQPDGGIHSPESLWANYETCLALMCLQEANKDNRFSETIQRGRAFLTGIQWDQSEGRDRADTSYGGAGYGSHKRPDLSNTAFLIDTLRATGSSANDEAIQRALVFVSRCQNLESPHNTTEHATKNPDGGFYYTVAAGGSSQAGTTEQGGLRSYGSMTYAGLKSMIYAGVGPEDERVKAALEWLRQHYSVDTNPGMGDAGLYYYYHTMAKALAALGEPKFVDDQGKSHDWRGELAGALISRQREDGSWVNDTPRWMEGDPNLTTGYALLALSYCLEQPAGGNAASGAAADAVPADRP